jgi:NADP-dependent 3-hydroxy acid dehydrogenase YdfG
MIALITGASEGIGRGIVDVFANAGITVAAIARDMDKLHALQDDLNDEGVPLHIYSCDVSDFKQCEETIAKIESDLDGTIDVLVNNAGVVIRQSIEDLGLDDWHQMVQTNVNGVFYMSKLVIPAMKKKGIGHIINMSSISGYHPLPGGSGYAATKYAVTGLSESMFHELRDYGIKVTTVFPGSVGSNSHGDGSDDSWKINPEEVGEACYHIINTSTGNCISRVEIRPLKKP